jgi:multidrug resistance protein MdtO
MATAAQIIRQPASPLQWFGQFLKEELRPYPGRTEVVARTVLAATLTMVACMTLRVPFDWQGVIYAFLVSRESPRATLQSVATIFLVTVIAAAYFLVSVNLVISQPSLHLFWILVTFFLGFYAISTAANYTAAVIWVNMISAEVPLWDHHAPAEINVEQTIWLCFAVLIGVVITAGVELAFSRAKPGEEIVSGLTHRLAAVQNVIISYAEERPIDPTTEANITSAAMVGGSRLRRLLARSNYSPRYAEQMGGVIALTARLVQIAANLGGVALQLTEDDRRRVRRLAENVGGIRSDLLAGRTPHLRESFAKTDALQAIPLLPEMENIVGVLVEASMESGSPAIYAPQQGSGEAKRTFFVRDAFSNIDHVKFAVKGCLTAGLCYVIYNAIDWPGISTAVTTCFLTALSTTGSSRQKQVLRFAGATFGGFVLGMGSQIFVLPHLDSIAGFTILVMLVTAFASWIATSSARLSYFGLQVALAFYLINLQSFAIEPSLAIARDRVVGVLLGLLMMWLVFDQLWGAPAVHQMIAGFVSVLRLLGQFAREPISGDPEVAWERCFALREKINKLLDAARDAADAVLFEFGPTRQRSLALRSRFNALQPQLRALFLTRVGLWKYRAQLPGFELPETIVESQREFDGQSAKMLDGIADRVEGRATQEAVDLEQAFNRLEEAVRNFDLEQPRELRHPRLETFLLLFRRHRDLATSLNQQIRRVEGF